MTTTTESGFGRTPEHREYDHRENTAPQRRVDVATVRSGEPLLRMTWSDPVTGAQGYLVVHTLVSDLATGGTRMRAGCTMSEVEDLAGGMAAKTADRWIC